MLWGNVSSMSSKHMEMEIQHASEKVWGPALRGVQMEMRGDDLIVIYCKTHCTQSIRSLAHPSALRHPFCCRSGRRAHAGPVGHVISGWGHALTGDGLCSWKCKTCLLLLLCRGPPATVWLCVSCICSLPSTRTEAHHRPSPPQKVHRCAAGYRQR